MTASVFSVRRRRIAVISGKTGGRQITISKIGSRIFPKIERAGNELAEAFPGGILVGGADGKGIEFIDEVYTKTYHL